MNITKAQVDALNAIVTVAITKEDYSDKVEKVLADYRKNAAISGFRKGAVPMSLIQKNKLTKFLLPLYACNSRLTCTYLQRAS